MASSASLPAAARDWAALPRDVLWGVFIRAGQNEILRGAGFACAAWWRLARDEPALWRRVDLTTAAAPDDDREHDDLSSDDDYIRYSLFDHDNSTVCSLKSFSEDDDFIGYSLRSLFGDDEESTGYSLFDDVDDEESTGYCEPTGYFLSDDDVPVHDCDEDDNQFDYSKWWEAMARGAVDRSAGQCEAFRGRANDEILLYLADRAPSLKSLHVTPRYDVSCEVLTEVIKKFPVLEELELVLVSCTYKKRRYKNRLDRKESSNNSWAELLQSACEACNRLSHFAVRHVGDEANARSYYEREGEYGRVFTIPTMHFLRSLKLFGDTFPKAVLLNIVDGCPNLQSLDMSDILYLKMDEELQAKCSRIKDLSLPPDYDSEESDYDFDGCCCDDW